MSFNQQYQGAIQNVYNVSGDLVLTDESTPADLMQQIEGLKADIAALKRLDRSASERIEGEIAAAETEGRSKTPKGEVVKAHLDNAAGILKGASGVAEQGGKLAKTLTSLGTWAAAFFS